MDKQDFSDIINNMKDLTLGQIISLVRKLKYKTIVMIITFVVVTLGGAFGAGAYSHSKDTAVMLNKPFAMRLELNGQRHDFETLTLMKDPTAPILEGNKVILSLREIKSSFDIVPIGQVVATMEEDKLTGLWRVIISKSDMVEFVNEAQAHDVVAGFNWRGHEKDFDFKERFVSKTTVHRYYSDGCVLAYDVYSNRRSDPESFRWIETTH